MQTACLETVPESGRGNTPLVVRPVGLGYAVRLLQRQSIQNVLRCLAIALQIFLPFRMIYSMQLKGSTHTRRFMQEMPKLNLTIHR